VNSTPQPDAIEPDDTLIARADERLAHAYEQITRADEQLARLTEQLAKMERDTALPPAAGPDPQSPARAFSSEADTGSHKENPSNQESRAPFQFNRSGKGSGRPWLRALVGLLLAACIVAAALVSQSSYGGRARLVIARWAPQLVSAPSLPSENPPFPAQPAPSTVRVATAEAAPPQATRLAQTAPQDAAPTAAAALPDYTQLLQTMASDLANVEREIEQVRANQQQMTSDTSKAIEQLKASQEEMKRMLAKVSEQNLAKTPPPPTKPAPTVRKPVRTLQSPYARARPRIPREWMYEDW